MSSTLYPVQPIQWGSTQEIIPGYNTMTTSRRGVAFFGFLNGTANMLQLDHDQDLSVWQYNITNSDGVLLVEGQVFLDRLMSLFQERQVQFVLQRCSRRFN